MTRPADVRQPYRLDDELHDEVLLNLARHHADIESLLATFFGFLERRTDFFHVLEEPSIRGRPSCSPEGRSMGFREGRAAQMVCDVFSRAQERYRRRAQPHLLKEPLSFSQNLDDKISRSSAAPARASPGCTGQQTSEAATKDSLGVLAQPPEGVGEPGDGAQTKAGKLEAHPVPSGGREASKPGADKITTWNGGECGRYRWSQTFTDLTVQINLDRSKYRSKKDLSVVITSHKLKVMLARKSGRPCCTRYHGTVQSDCNQEAELGNKTCLPSARHGVICSSSFSKPVEEPLCVSTTCSPPGREATRLWRRSLRPTPGLQIRVFRVWVQSESFLCPMFSYGRSCQARMGSPAVIVSIR